MKSDCGQEKPPSVTVFRVLTSPRSSSHSQRQAPGTRQASQEMTIIVLELVGRGLWVLASKDMYTKIWDMK